MKKTILYVITQGEWGGAQRYVYDLVSNLKDNFEVFIAIGETKGRKDLQNKILNSKPEILNKFQIQIIQLKHLVRNISPIHDILAVFELAKLYKKLKPDIIHLNSSKAGIIGSLAKIWPIWKLEIGNWKLFYTVHGWIFNEPSRKLGRWLYRFLEKWTAKLKDKIIVLSDRDFDDGVKLGIDENKLVKIPLGISQPQFLDKEEARKKLFGILKERDSSSAFGLARNDILIGTIANLYKTKGLDVLVEAVKILTQRDPSTSLRSAQDDKKNYIFFVIGEGPERKKLELQITNYKLQNIYLIGTIENAVQYLKAFDLFVLPSRKEGTPYTILEAVSAELPIVATDVGGIKELVPNAITTENPEILAKAIIKTIENPTSTKKNIPSLEEMINKTKAIYSSDCQAGPCL